MPDLLIFSHMYGISYMIFICAEHAKDALELAKMQEMTSQLKHQESIKVCMY